MRPTVSLMLLLLLSACIPGTVARRFPPYVPSDPFYPEPKQVDPSNLDEYSVEPIPKDADADKRLARLAYIELDDMGDLWNDSQVRNAEKMILNANEQARGQETGAIVLTYVHGWHQNADPTKISDASNLEMFKRILGWTAYDEAVHAGQSGRVKRPVVGVYMGWRGITGYWPVDYYNRHLAAGRVAGSNATEALLRVTHAARENPQTRSIVVGHSMGGLIVERSLIPALDAYLLKLKDMLKPKDTEISQYDPQEVRRYLPADLILLINPASHAIEASKFIGTLQRLQVQFDSPPHSRNCKFFKDNVPWPLPIIVSLTSEGDSATRVILNLAAYPMAMQKSFRKYSEKKYNKDDVLDQRDLALHTAGNFVPLASHWVRHKVLESYEEDECKEAAKNPGPIGIWPCEEEYFDEWRNSAKPLLAEDQIPPITYPTLCFESGDVCGRDRFWILQKRQTLNAVQIDNRPLPSPYWIMRIPKSVVENHSEIFTLRLERLVRGLLRFSSAVGVVPAEGNRSEMETGCDNINPDTVRPTVREPIPCAPPPPLRLAFKGLRSGCSSKNSSPCFRGETFRFHLERISDGMLYEAEPCEAIQWDFADNTQVLSGNSVDHLLPVNFELAAVEVKSSVANRWISLGVTPRFVDESESILPKITYRGKNSNCPELGAACWRGEPIQFEVVDPATVEATWHFDGERKEGTPVEHKFATLGTHEVHVGVVRGPRGGEATIEVPVESHCLPPKEQIAIEYSGERSNCRSGGTNCMSTEVISFTLANLSADQDENCFTVEWSYGDGAKGNGLNASHRYRAATTTTVSASVTSANVTVMTYTQVALTCPPPQPILLAYSGQSSGCSRDTVASGQKLCTLGEQIEFSIPPEYDIAECSEIEWSFLPPAPGDSSYRQVHREFSQPVSTVSVQVRSAGMTVSDAALIRLYPVDVHKIDTETNPILVPPIPVPQPPTQQCPQLGGIAISYTGEKGCTVDKKCSPGEKITFSIVPAVPAEGPWVKCPEDKILWLFDDGSEQHDPTATKAFQRGKPPHAVHLVIFRNGRAEKASTTVNVPLLKCRSCSGGS